MALRLCEVCMRHVRDHEARCPFCDAALGAIARAAPKPARARALQFAVVAIALAGCEEKKPDPVSTPPKVDPVATAPVVIDTGTAIADTYTEPVDAFSGDVSTALPHPRPKPTVTVTVTATAKLPPPNLNKPYGAPPADGLLV